MGRVPGLSLAGPGPADTSVSDRGACRAPRGERVANSSARRSASASRGAAPAAPAQSGSAQSSTAQSSRGSRVSGAPGTPVRAEFVSSGQPRRTYVLDTSVLLADPAAIGRFAEHRVVLPIVVITELEAKRHHPELGYFARQALRYLDDLRVTYGRLDADLPVGDSGGSVRVELNHSDPAVLPDGFRLGDNDTRILSVACSLAAEGESVILVSKDLPLRVKAAAIGLTAQEYRAELPPDSGWTGMAELDVTAAEIDELYDTGHVELAAARDLPCHTGLVLISGVAGSGSALGRVQPDKSVKLVRGDREAFGLRGRSAEQRIALDLLLDSEVGIVSLGGRAGTGKSALALCAGLEAVMERRQHRKLVVFRPLYAVGGQDLGYLPGSEADKMNPWAQAVFDTLSAVTSQNVIDEVIDRDMLEVLPLTHIRGRSLHDSFVVVDEAQSLERGVLLTVLSRIGAGSRVVLTHDIAQRDNLRVGRHDGVVAVIEKLKGHPLFSHVTLVRSERSPIAALVTEMLEDSGL
jgi:PhoH-like ATPase